MRRLPASIVTLCLLAGATAAADLPDLAEQIYRSVLAGDDRRAAALVEEYLTAASNDADMLYQAACIYSRLGEREQAVTYLVRAVRAGVGDLSRIARDPDLAAIKDHPAFVELLARADRTAESEGQAALDRWRSIHGRESYRYELDRTRRLAYATALDSESHAAMRVTLERQADHLAATLLGAHPHYFILIAVPTPEDASRLFEGDHIGGLYEHARRQLIARDIGSSLRHEFFHAMHYAHMESIAQHHPLWVQEGMASLYENYTVDGSGAFRFLHNERHNIVKRLSANNRLVRWRDLFGISDERFMARAGQLYPQVRSIFEFLADEGNLAAWYQALVDQFDADTTGATAFETSFGLPVEEVEHRWRKWLDRQPFVDVSIEPGDAALGIETNLNGSNDGVLITGLRPRSAAARSDLRVGDTIVAVDGKPTRSLAELKAIIASRKVGEQVRIRARRDGKYLTVVVTLRPLQPMRY
jgi:hypothetical protein